MSNKASRWLRDCGIGCALVGLVVIGHDPEDGPERTVDGRRERLLAGDEDEQQDALCAPRSLRHRWRRTMSAMLDNQLAALRRSGGQ